jgi:hypothetical protein
MVKNTTSAGDWWITDSMRGFSLGAEVSTNAKLLKANSSDAEFATYYSGLPSTTSNGFFWGGSSSSTYIYIAIRRGPMKVPTDATKVFAPVTDTGTSSAKSISAGFTVDMGIRSDRNKINWYPNTAYDRLQGTSVYLNTNATSANIDFTPFFTSFDQNGITLTNSGFNASGEPYINWFFQRAPSFFDEVCYTGNLTANTPIPHNLKVIPELIIIKSRSAAAQWPVYNGASGNQAFLILNTTAAVTTGDPNVWAATTPTSSNFYIGASGYTNINARTYVAYLFATCNGVSKVGSYTGNGTTQTINCGFTSGARFVLIKRTDYAGDWYVYDTARGMTILTDPYLLLNSTAAETATLGSVTTVSTGFALNETILSGINSSSATYIFLAIA